MALHYAVQKLFFAQLFRSHISIIACYYMLTRKKTILFIWYVQIAKDFVMLNERRHNFLASVKHKFDCKCICLSVTVFNQTFLCSLVIMSAPPFIVIDSNRHMGALMYHAPKVH